MAVQCQFLRVGLWRRLSTKEELMLFNCGVGENSWESLGLQVDPASPFWRRSALGVLGRTDAEAETPVLWSPDVKNWPVVSDSLWPHGLEPSRLLCPWGFSRQEYWSGLPCPPGDLPNPGIKLRSPTLRWILYCLCYQGSPRILEWVAYPFSRESSWPRNGTRVSCIAGRFFTSWTAKEVHQLI